MATTATAIVAAVGATAVATIATVTTAAAAGRAKIFFGNVTHCLNSAFDADFAVNELMVEVHFYIFGCNVDHEAFDAIAIGSHHRQAHAFLDVLFVKLAVDFKHFAAELDNLFGVVASERFLGEGDNVVAVA